MEAVCIYRPPVCGPERNAESSGEHPPSLLREYRETRQIHTRLLQSPGPAQVRDPSFHFDADPDPIRHFNVDPDSQCALHLNDVEWASMALPRNIRIRRIRMFLGLVDPDPLVKGTDPNRSIIKQK
jgi:hypothetical protein